MGAWIALAMVSAIFFEFPVGEKVTSLTESMFKISSPNYNYYLVKIYVFCAHYILML